MLHLLHQVGFLRLDSQALVDYLDLQEGPAHLNVVDFVLIHLERLAYLNERSEFGLVVFHKVLPVNAAVDLGVEPRH